MDKIVARCGVVDTDATYARHSRITSGAQNTSSGSAMDGTSTTGSESQRTVYAAMVAGPRTQHIQIALTRIVLSAHA